MSSLPQQKKTLEELTKLRESLGILAGPAPEADAATPEYAPPPTPVDQLRIHPSLERSARVGVPAPVPADSGETAPHPDVPAPAALPTHRGPRPIRSLKRSERQPSPSRPRATPPVTGGKLPGYRHSDEELAEIRRRSAVEAIAEGGFEPPASASKFLLGFGYLLSLGGAAAPTVLRLLAGLTDSYRLGMALDEGYHLLLAGCLTALPVAAYIALRKTQSRHHAAFISIIAFFALIFATLHYFPFLRHGT